LVEGVEAFDRQQISVRRRGISVRAITLLPGVPHSAQLEDIPEPAESHGSLLIRTLALGVCGTDREIVSGAYGEAPPGAERLVLGHESYGEVIAAPPGGRFAVGDRIVGIVRRPDPVPCPACAAGEWDMCRNGQYTERGIKGIHGFGSERFRIEPSYAIKVEPALGKHSVLLEPTSVVAKAWDHIERIGRRFHSWAPRRVLVTGAGPIGLLAAMMGMQRHHEVYVLDRATDGPKPQLVRDLGALYLSGPIQDTIELAPDIVIECTGAPTVIADVMGRSAPSGVVCLLGLGGHHEMSFDFGEFNKAMVLNNDVVFGSVNANRRHYELAAKSLADADQAWLGRLISRRVPLSNWQEALENRPDDIKVVIDFTL
jgi:threonine dehydrogenase-like Zn-dependent dehydrogenase